MKRKPITLLIMTVILFSLIGCGDVSVRKDTSKKMETVSKDEEDSVADSSKEGDLDADFSPRESQDDSNPFALKDKAPAALSVKIKGNTYLLSGDPHEVIGDMTKDGVVVFDMMRYTQYAEDGYLETDEDKKINLRKDRDKYENGVWLYGNSGQLSEDAPVTKHKCYLNYYEYVFKSSECEFETGDLISESSTKNDIEKLPGYIPYRGLVETRGDAYVAVYFDAEQVDLDRYKQDADDYKREQQENMLLPPEDSNRIFYNYGINNLVVSSIVNQNYDNWDELDSDILSAEIAVTRALQDGAQKLTDGEIENLSAVLYTSYNGDVIYEVLIYSEEFFYSNREE